MAERFAKLKEEFLANYERCMTQRTCAFDGVAHLIDNLQRRPMTWGVVTNKAQRFTVPLTRAMRLFDGASVVISGDTTAHAKPHPEPLLEAARRIGVAPKNCLYVGDDERDIIRVLYAPLSYMRPVMGPEGIPADRAQALRAAFDEAVRDPVYLDEMGKQRIVVRHVSHGDILATVNAIYATPAPTIARIRNLLGLEDR